MLGTNRVLGAIAVRVVKSFSLYLSHLCGTRILMSGMFLFRVVQRVEARHCEIRQSLFWSSTRLGMPISRLHRCTRGHQQKEHGFRDFGHCSQHVAGYAFHPSLVVPENCAGC